MQLFHLSPPPFYNSELTAKKNRGLIFICPRFISLGNGHDLVRQTFLKLKLKLKKVKNAA